jgi:hypothetical protein
MGPLNESDYIVLACIASETDANAVVPLRDVLNRNGAANWTVCPRCSTDDFLHTKNCTLRNCVSGMDEPMTATEALAHKPETKPFTAAECKQLFEDGIKRLTATKMGTVDGVDLIPGPSYHEQLGSPADSNGVYEVTKGKW